MLTTCRERKGRLHAVVVHSLTRFSTNSADHHAVQALLRGLGITLRSVTEPGDASLSGRLMEAILAAMEQFDKDVRSERVAAGQNDAPERGRWPWLAPIGYLNADAGTGPSIVPDPARAPAVREAFELYAAGIRGGELLDRVTDMGLLTKRGNKLSINRLYELLRNRAYIGLTSTAAWAVESKGDFEPLVSDDLFVRVQGEFAREAKESLGVTSHRNHPAFALRRFTMCEMCGRPLTGSQSTGRNKARYAFYHCIPGCTRVPAGKMEAAFLELLDSLRPRPDRQQALHTVLLDGWRLEEKTHRDTRTAANRRAGELEATLGRLDQAVIADQAIDAGSCRRQRDQVREELVLSRLEAGDAALLEADFESMLAFADHALHQASAIWTSAASTEERIRLQWTLFPGGCTWSPRIGNFERPADCLEFFEFANLQKKSHDAVVDRTAIEPVTS